jgi:hypothetical protein
MLTATIITIWSRAIDTRIELATTRQRLLETTHFAHWLVTEAEVPVGKMVQNLGE